MKETKIWVDYKEQIIKLCDAIVYHSFACCVNQTLVLDRYSKYLPCTVENIVLGFSNKCTA